MAPTKDRKAERRVRHKLDKLREVHRVQESQLQDCAAQLVRLNNATPAPPQRTPTAPRRLGIPAREDNGLDGHHQSINKKELKQLRNTERLYNQMTFGIRALPRMSRMRVLRRFTCAVKLKRSRLTSRLARDTGLDRRALLTGRRARNLSEFHRMYKAQKKDIIAFLVSPEHSYTLPGKKETVTVDRVKYQRVVLTEFIAPLHKMYLERYPGRNCSVTHFNQVRRSVGYIKSVSHSDTQVCLCVKHQNFTLRLRAVKDTRLPDTVAECERRVRQGTGGWEEKD